MPHVQSFSSKDEFNKNFGRTSFFLEGGGLKLCEPDVHPFFKASIPPSSRYSIHPFLQIILVQISQFPSPQAAATTYALSSVFILLLHMWPPFGQNCRNCSFLLQRISSRCRAGRISPSPGRRSTTTPSPRSPPWAGCSCHSSRFLCPVFCFVFYGIHCL